MNLCGFQVGLDQPLLVIAGPCVIEARDLVLQTAERLREITKQLAMPFVFKASFDKANRTSSNSFRGPGRDSGLNILREVRERIGCPVLTDVHSPQDVERAAEAVDILQIPAFLCRQTDLVQAAARSGLPVNIKKGQFLSPSEMVQVVNKARAANPAAALLVCERGFSFGYHNLVVDMRSLAKLRETGCPVIFDATHSVQLPGAEGGRSGGQREFVPVLARAAVAAGVAGVFLETHPRPEKALSDGPNAWPLRQMEPLLKTLKSIDQIVKGPGLSENSPVAPDRAEAAR